MLLKILLSIFAVQFSVGLATADTFVIPNSKRRIRDIHKRGAAAAWAHRTAVGYSERKEEHVQDDDAAEIQKETNKEYFLYLGLPGILGVESYMEKQRHDSYGSSGHQAMEYTDIQINGGLSFFGLLSLGAESNSLEYDYFSSTSKSTENGYSASLKLGSFYLGGGTMKGKWDSSNDKDDQEHYGVGIVLGDMRRPKLAGEIVLVKRDHKDDYGGMKGEDLYVNLWSYFGNSQPFVHFEKERNKYPDGSGYGTDTLKVGWDQQLGFLYLAPEYEIYKTDDDGYEEKTMHIEVGLRKPWGRLFGRYSKNDDDDSSDPSYTLMEKKFVTVGASLEWPL